MPPSQLDDRLLFHSAAACSGYLDQEWKEGLICWQPTAPLHHSAAALRRHRLSLHPACRKTILPWQLRLPVPANIVVWSKNSLTCKSCKETTKIWAVQIHCQRHGVLTWSRLVLIILCKEEGGKSRFYDVLFSCSLQYKNSTGDQNTMKCEEVWTEKRQTLRAQSRLNMHLSSSLSNSMETDTEVHDAVCNSAVHLQ